MKNIFKFFGIAVLACGMMVACGDKNEGDNTDTTPDTPTPAASVYTINYQGTWQPGATYFIDHTDQNYMTIYAWKSADDYLVTSGNSDVLIVGFMETVVGEFDYAGTQDRMELSDPTTFYYEGDEDNEAGNYFKYQADPSTFIENVTAFDANTLRYSATWAEQYYDVEEYATAGTVNYAEMTGTFQNFQITWATNK